MLAEPNIHPRAIRETAVELLFEKFQTPALFLAKNAVLSSFASGRQTSLVIDMGYESSVGELSAAMPHSPSAMHSARTTFQLFVLINRFKPLHSAALWRPTWNVNTVRLTFQSGCCLRG